MWPNVCDIGWARLAKYIKGVAHLGGCARATKCWKT